MRFPIKTVVKESTGQTYLELNDLIAYCNEIISQCDREQAKGLKIIIDSLTDMRDRKAWEMSQYGKGGFFSKVSR